MKPKITYDDFAKLDLRIATVLAAREHPNADKLMLLQIKVGEEEKQIVAGIRAYYPPEQLVGRQIVVVNNLQEVVLRGEESHGMLLAASDAHGVVLLAPRPRVRIRGNGEMITLGLSRLFNPYSSSHSTTLHQSVFVVGGGDAVGGGFDLGQGVAHRHAQAGGADHGDVVHVVADRADRRLVDPPTLGQIV